MMLSVTHRLILLTQHLSILFYTMRQAHRNVRVYVVYPIKGTDLPSIPLKANHDTVSHLFIELVFVKPKVQ